MIMNKKKVKYYKDKPSRKRPLPGKDSYNCNKKNHGIPFLVINKVYVSNVELAEFIKYTIN